MMLSKYVYLASQSSLGGGFTDSTCHCPLYSFGCLMRRITAGSPLFFRFQAARVSTQFAGAAFVFFEWTWLAAGWLVVCDLRYKTGQLGLGLGLSLDK
jgi:hypothetical protein